MKITILSSKELHPTVNYLNKADTINSAFYFEYGNIHPSKLRDDIISKINSCKFENLYFHTYHTSVIYEIAKIAEGLGIDFVYYRLYEKDDEIKFVRYSKDLIETIEEGWEVIWEGAIMLDERQLWIEYKRSGNLKIREELVLKYIPLVKYVVGKMIVNLPKNVEYDDLVEYGIIGLLDAVEKFDINKEITFKTYAVTRVRGSIYDELRAQDWLPRSVRKLVKEIERAYVELETKFKRMPSEEEVASFLDIPVKKMEEIYAKVDAGNVSSLDDTVYDGNDSTTTLANTVEDKKVENPQVELEKSELRATLIERLEELNEKERMVITLYYYEKLTLKEIGQVLEISESRVSQIHSKAIFKLKSKLIAKFGDYANMF